MGQDKKLKFEEKLWKFQRNNEAIKSSYFPTYQWEFEKMFPFDDVFALMRHFPPSLHRYNPKQNKKQR